MRDRIFVWTFIIMWAGHGFSYFLRNDSRGFFYFLLGAGVMLIRVGSPR